MLKRHEVDAGIGKGKRSHHRMHERIWLYMYKRQLEDTSHILEDDKHKTVTVENPTSPATVNLDTSGLEATQPQLPQMDTGQRSIRNLSYQCSVPLLTS